MIADRDEFVRLLRLVHAATRHVEWRTSALELYREARDVAERRLPGALGVAVAAVLAEEAHVREQSGMHHGTFGAAEPMVALALAVLGVREA